MKQTTSLKKRLNKLTDNTLAKAQKKLISLMTRDAKDGEIDLVCMHGEDLANIMYVCHQIKTGNFIEAHNHWFDLDTDPREMFPSTMTDILDKLSEQQQEENEKQ